MCMLLHDTHVTITRRRTRFIRWAQGESDLHGMQSWLLAHVFVSSFSPGWNFQPGRLTSLLHSDFISNVHVFTVLPGCQLEPLMMFGYLLLAHNEVGLDGIIAPAYQISNG